jgi:hypothetical protein
MAEWEELIHPSMKEDHFHELLNVPTQRYEGIFEC